MCGQSWPRFPLNTSGEPGDRMLHKGLLSVFMLHRVALQAQIFINSALTHMNVWQDIKKVIFDNSLGCTGLCHVP